MSRFLGADKMFTEEEIKRKRARIYRKMLKSGTTTDLKEGRPDLSRLFELYDKIFFRGQIQKKLDETNSTVEFKFSAHTSTAGTCSRKGCKWKINIPIKLFQGLFQKGEKNLLTNGIWCTSKLDCLQLTFEHELMHLLMQLYGYSVMKPEYDQPNDTFTGHGKLFQCMVFIYFGHTAYKHDLFKGEASTKIKKEDAQIGMRVKYFSNKDQEEYHGRIIKMNPKKAIVQRDDGREWNIPYTMLEQSDKSVPDIPKVPDIPVPSKPSTSTKDRFKVGMRITYIHKGKTHYGVIFRINPKRASVNLDDGTTPLIPYHMLKETDKPRKVLPGNEEPEKKNMKDEIRVGDWVRVKWENGSVRTGKVTRTNPSRAIILMEDGKSWNIYYQNILGFVDQKDKFKVGDEVSYVIDWRKFPGVLKRRGVEWKRGTIVEKTPTHTWVKGVEDKNPWKVDYPGLTKIDDLDVPQQTSKKKDIPSQKPKKQIIKVGDTVSFKSTEKLHDWKGKINQYTGVVTDIHIDDEDESEWAGGYVPKVAAVNVKDPNWEKYDVKVTELSLVTRKSSK